MLGSHGAVDGMCGIPFWLPAASCSRAIFGLQAAPWAAMGLGWAPLLKFSRVAGQQCEIRCVKCSVQFTGLPMQTCNYVPKGWYSVV